MDFDDESEDENANSADTQEKVDPRREVTYEVFADEIWPKISNKQVADYHPTLVWTEIMSFIKGSFEAVTKPEGYLSLEEYNDLGRKRAPNFTGIREYIYNIFVKYTHYKKQHFLFDESDLVSNIYKRLCHMNNQPWVIHQIFVDETQDFTQAELSVMIRISQNPNDMFLTGDTAQSIMRGISFRFNDLKSLFYYARKSLQARGSVSNVVVPKQVFQLTHNYRSHAGILSLASAILDLLVEFFPESFDRLQKDQGLFNGPLPVLLESCSLSDLAILLQGNKRQTSHIEFGAHQAILVVNDAARDSIPEELRLGLILTIYEAKGLEFDDVLLYNFFKDSQAKKEWRVVTEFLEDLVKEKTNSINKESLVEIDEEVLSVPNRPRPLAFDSNQHKVLNSELKHLYTALTRARVNVWIFDEDSDKRAPMFEYFKALKLVKYVELQQINEVESSEIFAEKSNPEDWIKRGDEIMKKYLYNVAAKCYKMGGDLLKEKLALAHCQALAASKMKDNPHQMKNEFIYAAEKFLETNHDIKAAQCLQNAQEYNMAAELFKNSGQYIKAAKLYKQCNKPLESSRCYEEANNYDSATNILYTTDNYEMVLECLERYRKKVYSYESQGLEVPKMIKNYKPSSLYTDERITYKLAEQYYNEKNEVKMLKAIKKLPRKQEQISFLIKKNYIKHASNLMLKEGKLFQMLNALNIFIIFFMNSQAFRKLIFFLLRFELIFT